MNICYPSSEFDEAVSAVCHGAASDEQMTALNKLLRSDASAKDEYILRLELHSRLASEPDLFAPNDSELSIVPIPNSTTEPRAFLPDRKKGRNLNEFVRWAGPLAACLALLATLFWSEREKPAAEQKQVTSKAIAMLNRTIDAQWKSGAEAPRLHAPLEPGLMRLEAGSAQIIFYSGARIIFEGPTEIELISATEVFCSRGRLVLETPPQARGFHIKTPHLAVTDPGSSIGLEVKDGQTILHAFQGSAKLTRLNETFEETLSEGLGVAVGSVGRADPFNASTMIFASLFDFKTKSQAAEARRYNQWQMEYKRLEKDPSLLVHFNFLDVDPSGWELPNTGNLNGDISPATIIGCQWTEGRWPEKRALEFQSVNDRVRLKVPGEFPLITLSAWVSVKGLDRKVNSLFMSDGFAPRTLHWLIRNDGVLGLTVIGENPHQHQIILSPPVITLENFGMWLHLAVALDGISGQVIHYLNGVAVSKHGLTIDPPFQIGVAELGNWNAKGFPENDPFMIRNFSGAIDEFSMFNRALNSEEIQKLYKQGKPQREPLSPQ